MFFILVDIAAAVSNAVYTTVIAETIDTIFIAVAVNAAIAASIFTVGIDLIIDIMFLKCCSLIGHILLVQLSIAFYFLY